MGLHLLHGYNLGWHYKLKRAPGFGWLPVSFEKLLLCGNEGKNVYKLYLDGLKNAIQAALSDVLRLNCPLFIYFKTGYYLQ